jgi:hypothetical protein
MWSERTSPEDEREPSQNPEAPLVAYANRDLDPAAATRLRATSQRSPELQQALEDYDRLHAALDAERALVKSVLPPATTAEEADPVYRKLQRGAARAEELILERVRTLGVCASGAQPPRYPTGRRVAVAGIVGLAAAAVLWLVWWIQSPAVAPGLLPGVPDPRLHAGPSIVIVLDTAIDRSEPRLSWGFVANARSYTVTLRQSAAGSAGAIVFIKDKIPAAEPTCLIDAAVLRDLPPGSPLELLITAQDSEGTTIASSGDLRVRVL